MLVAGRSHQNLKHAGNRVRDAGIRAIDRADLYWADSDRD
jgi:hypothetical protein